MTVKNKQIISGFIALVSVVLPIAASAGLPPQPAIRADAFFGGFTIETVLLRLVDWGWKIFVVIAVLLFIYAGTLFLTAAGNESQLSTAKKAAIWGVVGVAVAIIGFSIITIVQGGIVPP